MALHPAYEYALTAFRSRKKAQKQLFKALRKSDTREVRQWFAHAHEEAFQKIDCLECGNCCRTLSPRFTEKDIERLAAHLRMKPGQFVEKYLTRDEDNDYVLKESPCPFLGEDNYCSVYEHRPKACRAYPHTDDKKIAGMLNLTRSNAKICPAVVHMLENIEQKINT